LLNKLLTFLLAIVCIVFIVFGQMYWKDKTQQATASTSTVNEEGTNTSTKTNDKGAEDNASTDSISLLSEEEMKDSIQNLPDDVQSTILSAYENGESVSMLIIGSTAIGDKENGSASLFRDELQTVYGEDFFQIDTFGFDGYSNEFVEELPTLEIADKSYDFVLMEPFTLSDNGYIPTANNHDNIETTLTAFQENNENTILMLQPPQPIYDANFYPSQVEDLKEFAEEQGYAYFDHWTSWPDPESEEILDYLDDESNPNEDGAKLWANALAEIFISE
jgi:hypothetical protein